MMTAERTVIVEIGVDRQGMAISLIFMQNRRAPIRNRVLFIEFRDLVETPVLPVFLPVFSEVAHDVVGEFPVDGQSFRHGAEIPVGGERRRDRVDGRPVVAGEILYQNRRVCAAPEVAVGEIGGSGRLHAGGDVEDSIGVAREGGVVLVLPSRAQIETEFEARGDLDVDVRTNAELIVICRAHFVDTVLVLSVELNEVRHLVRTAVDAHAVLVLRGERLDDLVEPVRVRIKDGVVLVDVVLNLGLIVVGRSARNGQFGVVGLGEQHGIRHADQPGRLLQAEIVGEGHGRGVIVLAAFRGHQNDSVCGTSAVDCGGGVLQDIDALDFIPGQPAEFVSAAGHTIDDDKGFVLPQCAASADEHDCVVPSRFSGTVVHDDAG